VAKGVSLIKMKKGIIEFVNLLNTVMSYSVIYLSILVALLLFGQVIYKGCISILDPFKIIFIGFGFGFAMWLRKQECYFSEKTKAKGGKER